MESLLTTPFDRKVDYPVGIQDFTTIRENGYLYVDKTAVLYGIVRKGGFFFLSRPRRFGKSLMISTLEAFYEGKRDLFKGLALDKLIQDWEPHPVFHLDLSKKEYTSADDLRERLSVELSLWENRYGVEYTDGKPSNELRFSAIISAAYQKTGKKVAILVDEYDNPMLSAIGNPELEEDYRRQLKAFYSNLKSMGRYIEVAVLTGVARFSKISIFSDLNNLNDITFDDRYSAICGVTAAELTQYFNHGIEELSQKLNQSKEYVCGMLKEYYDGYHFSPQSPDIYNPFSLVNVFDHNHLDSYWFQSGTPSFLLNRVVNSDIKLPKLAPFEIEESALKSAGILSTDPIPAFYQSGYLTIKSYDSVNRSFILDYPNREVKQGFLEYLVPYYLRKDGLQGDFSINKFIQTASRGDIKEFMKLLEALISGIPYSEKGTSEDHFRSAMYLLITLLGFRCKVEERTSSGRIDLLVETNMYIYIFEFKIDKSAQAAMDQLLEKKYWIPFETSGKQICLIGADFNTSTRCLSSDPLIHWI